jgi:site-specific recombinase XerD
MAAAAKGSNWVVSPSKYLTPTEVAILRATVERDRVAGLTSKSKKAVRDAVLVELLLGTGLRVSEACSLVVSDLFLERGAGNILVRRGKGGRSRIVAIPDRLVAYLVGFLEWKCGVNEGTEPTCPLFVSERKRSLTRFGAHRTWKAALSRAGLPTRWGVHATRHSYAVEVYRKTRDLRLTQRLLGHSSPATTQVYANLLDDDVRAGVEKVWAA